ncbi:MAG: 1,2-dihydroxy-3-keto-5-methylthiopentene dioxygenase [Leptospirales bacterium]
MPILTMETGEILAERQPISDRLSSVGVSLEYWPVVHSGESGRLLASPTLSGPEKETVLSGHDAYFDRLRTSLGYQSRDLVVLSPETPGLEGILSAFVRVHLHEDDEVRYIVDGEGVFGFVLRDGSQAELLVQAGDFINVPRNTEHWFRLTGSRRIKAIRYFTSTAGWVPVYTATPLKFAGPPS